MKKFALGLIALVLVASGFTSASGATEDEQWPIPNEYGQSHHSVLIEDSSGRYDFFSLLRMRSGNDEFLCSSFDASPCDKAQYGIYNAILPPCNGKIVTDCIISLEAISPTGEVFKAEFKEFIYGGKHPNLFRGDGISTPKSISEPGIWTLNSATHSGGNEYALSVGLSNNISRSKQDLSDADMDVQLYPISRLATGYLADDVNGFANFYKCIQRQETSGRYFVSCGGGAQEFGKYRCAMKMIENATCLLRRPFPAGLRFRVQIQLTFEPAGMLHGRLIDPDIQIEKNQDGTLIRIEAGSTRVPILYSGGNYSTLPSEIQQYWDECVPQNTCGFSSRVAFGNDRGNPLTRNIQDYAQPFGDRSLKLVSIFSKEAQDMSVAAPSAWNVRTLSKEKMRTSPNCLKRENGFIGVITTNSTTYSEGPPAFEDGILNYKVASLHYLPNGDVFKGNYNLVLRSDVARCLYGFSKAPISASISILSADGSNQVATTVVNERDNWLYLTAAGFTFSSPTIKVKLTQETPVASPTPKPEITTQAAPAKKFTITCTKGKLKKKISAAAPKCPTGYKKAA